MEETPKTMQLPVSGTGASLPKHSFLYSEKTVLNKGLGEVFIKRELK